ncbi:MAG: DUF3224 domain-containing protein [bacterium]
MHLDGTFKVDEFKPATLNSSPMILTALPTGLATMRKSFSGAVSGTSTTLFTAAFDQTSGQGTYLAMEAFQGSLGQFHGAFNFVHSATTAGKTRTDEFFLIVPNSGTADLKGISGTGGIAIDPDGRHRIWFEIAGLD